MKLCLRLIERRTSSRPLIHHGWTGFVLTPAAEGSRAPMDGAGTHPRTGEKATGSVCRCRGHSPIGNAVMSNRCTGVPTALGRRYRMGARSPAGGGTNGPAGSGSGSPHATKCGIARKRWSTCWLMNSSTFSVIRGKFQAGIARTRQISSHWRRSTAFEVSLASTV